MERADPGEGAEQFLRQAVSEERLVRVGAEVGERHHGDAVRRRDRLTARDADDPADRARHGDGESGGDHGDARADHGRVPPAAPNARRSAGWAGGLAGDRGAALDATRCRMTAPTRRPSPGRRPSDRQRPGRAGCRASRLARSSAADRSRAAGRRRRARPIDRRRAASPATPRPRRNARRGRPKPGSTRR